MTQPNLPLDPANAGGSVPDPWGMKRVENLITSLVGVVAGRPVVAPLGQDGEDAVDPLQDLEALGAGAAGISA